MAPTADVSWPYVAPMALVVAAIALVAPVASRLRPRLGTWCLTSLALSGAVAAAGILGGAMLGGLPGGLTLAERLGWCRRMAGHGSRPVAVLAGVLAVLALGNVVRLVRRQRREVAGLGGGSPIQVVNLATPGAFAVPGRPGSIVVTTGLLAVLSTDERRAMFAHERAHLDLHHHRFVRVVSLAAAAVPVLRPLVARVRFATERWADERAADEVGDRSSVADALARAALGGGPHPPAPALGAASLGVAARVRALGVQPRRSRCEPVALVLVVVAAGAAATQSHHLVTMLAHLCA